ncbi:xanthine dehydrogenase family protein molybdopterin-binding subunit [Bradyrhizobium sp. KBS0727]|nr:xanthine dehydrogenase family protein molybdopterin-binding subunit [Bradyrhizobium sp. KBS0725]QDW48758.1 xanthine dehydrogenase family protein molybdopterin-binding subunit [Bradyrhizobium sp. KBS0727]
MPAGQVGRSLPRLEARQKVTGRADYVHNMRVPGMLVAKVARSSMAHGRIVSIDVSAARQVDGVFAVYTGEDIQRIIPEPYYGPAFHDQPILALGKVRYVGEPVAVALALDPHVAERAAQLVEVEYEEFPAVFDEVEAMDTKAIVHDVLKPAGTFPDLKHLHGKKNTNIALDFHLKRGDVEKAFADAAHVFEHEFRTQPVMHTPLEPMVSLAEPTPHGLTIHTASQSPSFVRIEIARLLGWPENKVQVKVPHLGGGFGAKLYIKLEALVTALALLAKRPVKLSLTMEEQFYTITKHATTLKIKSAVDGAGQVTGRRCTVYWNGGAYADIGPRVTQKSGFTAPGPYDIENVAIDSYALYTNRPPAGALRGFGIPQLVWAYESHTDLIARALNIDPVEFRRKNILREGLPQATGTIMKDAAIDLVLEKVAERMNWSAPFDRGNGTVRRGRGVGIGFKASISPTTSVAFVNIYADGSCALHMSTVDMGQGSDTAMAQIVAEVLRVQAETIRVIHPDTDVTPYDMATLGSRSTYHMGNAVKLAAEDAKQKLEALARSVGVPEGANLETREIFKKKYGMQAGNVMGVGSYIPTYQSPDPATGMSDNITPFWMVGGTGVEIEVDTETGHVRLTKLINAADMGRPLNPRIVETQLSGAAIMQLGFTMFENMEFDAGQVTNASFADYKIPGIHDIPSDIENHIVAANQSGGPFGAKGVGESATFGVSPAIANAIHDAVGIRLTDLPLSAESVLRGIRLKAGNPIGD